MTSSSSKADILWVLSHFGFYIVIDNSSFCLLFDLLFDIFGSINYTGAL